jgi:hypothetical protein
MFKKFKNNIQAPSYAGKYRKVIGRIPYSKENSLLSKTTKIVNFILKETNNGKISFMKVQEKIVESYNKIKNIERSTIQAQRS